MNDGGSRHEHCPRASRGRDCAAKRRVEPEPDRARSHRPLGGGGVGGRGKGQAHALAVGRDRAAVSGRREDRVERSKLELRPGLRLVPRCWAESWARRCAAIAVLLAAVRAGPAAAEEIVANYSAFWAGLPAANIRLTLRDDGVGRDGSAGY